MTSSMAMRSKDRSEFSVRRTVLFALWSASYCGCGQHYIFNVLFTRAFGSGTSFWVALRKAAADSFIATPLLGCAPCRRPAHHICATNLVHSRNLTPPHPHAIVSIPIYYACKPMIEGYGVSPIDGLREYAAGFFAFCESTHNFLMSLPFPPHTPRFQQTYATLPVFSDFKPAKRPAIFSIRSSATCRRSQCISYLSCQAMVWIPAHLLTFTVVPPVRARPCWHTLPQPFQHPTAACRASGLCLQPLRIAWSATVSLGWLSFVSMTSHRPNEE